MAGPRRRMLAGRLWRGLAGGYWRAGFGGALPADTGGPALAGPCRQVAAGRGFGFASLTLTHGLRPMPEGGTQAAFVRAQRRLGSAFRRTAHCQRGHYTIPHFIMQGKKPGEGGSGEQKEFWEIKAAPFPGVIRRERRWSGFCICQFYYLTRILLISYSSSGICLVMARASWMSKSTKAPPL